MNVGGKIRMNSLSINMRPSSLPEFIGNEAVVESLQKQMCSPNPPTAIMFVGPPGVGKTTLALIAARLVQGEDHGPDDPIDLTEVNCGSENGVDAMRALVESASFLPLTGKRKVFVLNESQKLTDAAQQCLLDPTEKKDSSALYIFTTTDPEKINTALKTRCKIFRLSGMAEVQTRQLIERASGELGVEYDDRFLVYAMNRKSSGWSARELLNAYEMYVTRHAAGAVFQCHFSPRANVRSISPRPFSEETGTAHPRCSSNSRHRTSGDYEPWSAPS
jgi:DNA polymerase III gamma/tau subunit